jgi:hypothetical protein
MTAKRIPLEMENQAARITSTVTRNSSAHPAGETRDFNHIVMPSFTSET